MQTHASIKKESKERAQEEEAREKKIDQKEQKRLLLLGIEPCTTCKYGPYTAVYRSYGVYIRSAQTHIRSYGYGTGGSVSYTVPDIRRTEDTAYIRSYGLGQPYTYTVTQGTLQAPWAVVWWRGRSMLCADAPDALMRVVYRRENKQHAAKVAPSTTIKCRSL